MSKTVERLIKYLKPEKYDIMSDFSDGKDEFRGEVEISGEALGREVRLNAEEMKINDVSVFRDGEHLDFKYEHSDGELVITNLTEGEIKIRVEYIGINLDTLEQMSEKFNTNDITVDLLKENCVISRNEKVKVLGRGELTKAINVTVNAISKNAKAAIESKGGVVTVI